MTGSRGDAESMVSGEEALSADEALNAAVVRVGGENGTIAGGGFLVTSDRVLTCAHVVSDALGRRRDLAVPVGAEVLIDFPLVDGAAERHVVAEVEQWIPEAPKQCGDVAVLRLRDVVPGTRPLPLAASAAVSHRPVRVVGFPDDELGVVWHRGELSGKSSGDWIQLSRADSRTTHITGGYSGSPVWDEQRGAVVGLVVAAQRKRDDTQQSFAISVKAALAKLPDLDRELAAHPFRGIDTFQERHEDIFFGRDSAIEDVAAELERPRRTTVTLFGPSGCGKSSLALAGVVPRMRRGSGEGEDDDDRPGYEAVVVNAGADGSLLSRLAVDLYEAVRTGRYGDRRAESVDQVEEWLAGKGLVRTLNILRGASDGRYLVVLDQAEALLHIGDEEFGEVAGLLFPEGGPTAGSRLLVTLRSDFMDAALRHPRLGPLVGGSKLLPLAPMSRDQLKDVITRPVEKAPAVEYDPGLVDRILEDACREPENLPLLGFLLKKLWDNRSGGRLRTSTYQALNGVKGALKEHCETAWKQYVGEGERIAAARLLRGLVRVPPGSGKPLRRRITRKEAGDAGWELARSFGAQPFRLLVLRGGHGQPETAELAHEKLIEVWPALRDQVREDERFLTGRAELNHDLDRWTQQERPSALLPGEVQLAYIQAWVKGRETELDAAERDFLERARQRRRLRRARGRAAWTAAAAVFALIVGLGTFLVYQQRVSTQREEDGRSRLLANYSDEVAKQDPGQGALIALGAYGLAPTNEARNAVLRRYDQVKNAAWVLSGTEGSIRDVAMSVDGTVTFVTTENGRATLFVRQAGGRIHRLQLDLDEMAFHPLVSRDGRQIAHVSGTGVLVRYEVDPAADRPEDMLRPQRALRGPEFEEMADALAWVSKEERLMALSPDAGSLVTMVNGRLTLWDLATGRRQDVPGRPVERSESVWFGPDENTLLVSRTRTGGSDLVMDAVDVLTGKARELADGVDDSAMYGSATALSGDGGVLAFCRRVKKDEGHVAVYSALRVRDGRPLHTYTYAGPNSGCGDIAVDEKGERFAVNHHEAWMIVGTRRGSRVTRAEVASPDLVVGRLLGGARHPVVPVVTYGDNHVTAQPLIPRDIDGSDIVVGSPRLVGGGKYLLAQLHQLDEPDKGETLALVDAATGRIVTEVKRPTSGVVIERGVEHDLLVNDAGTLVADVIDRDRVLIREIPSLRRVAEVTTHEPPVDRGGGPEALTLTFLRGGDELVTLSGSRIEHWDARTGRRLSAAIDARALGLTKKNPPRFGSGRPEAQDSGFAVNSHAEKGYVQIMVARAPVLHAVHLRTGEENKDLSVRLGPRVERAIRDSSGRYAAAKSPGGMLELWSTATGERPARLVGPLGPLGADEHFTGDGYAFSFTGADSEFFIANGGSVRFQQLSDPNTFQTYDFAAHQHFLATTKDGRTLLRTLSGGSFGGGNGDRGRLDLIHLDPELWKRHLCAVVGRDLTAEERSGLPSGLPEGICPA
ncbi:trypsin-like peptidase domain-containing protein [Streptomyces sp. VB1]|uniref:nSTAND1 domain-containing NTPase n=1 Tax=Streptomyces sp. VB1 TaxID=2986803 RepID=UPI002242C4B5|nr:trypsin-like peptidase domain-containing protein [Streptomyces sp. VB1]UZI30611.1 trypsin-like peptidase domain-containing protein [Streptomyces sp. VB1]